MSSIVDHFRDTPLSKLRLSSPVVATPDTPVRDVVATMAARGVSCAFVQEGPSMRGMFTENDVALRVVTSPDVWDQPIANFMRIEPAPARVDLSALDALRIMNERRSRNLAVVSATDVILGSVTHYDLIGLASRYLRSHQDLGHEPTPEHSLAFVDLTGIHAHDPILVDVHDSLLDVIERMRTAHLGLASVVDARGALIGEFSEQDIFERVACQIEDLEDREVGSWMTEQVAALPPASSIADGLHLMSDVGHRYLVLLNETRHPLGVVTFRDIAEYFETALEVV